MNSQIIIKNLIESEDYIATSSRRDVLISSMSALEKSGIHCANCPGTCCTSKSNSMMITPLEALEILNSLMPKLLIPEEKEKLISALKNSISQFRLDKEIYTGKKNSQTLRRHYTCPFFNNGSLGCGLSRKSKPYGCLAFNPKIHDDNGKTCSSQTELLETRQAEFQNFEDQLNLKIKTELKINWEKQNIPMAVLEMIAHFYT